MTTQGDVSEVAVRDPARIQSWEADTPFTASFPNAFTYETLRRVASLNYLVVLAVQQDRIERLVRAHYSREADSTILDNLLREKMRELSRDYPPSDYDILLCHGDLFEIMNALPKIRGWESVTIEDVVET
jgi:hypothetical protein